MFWTGIGKPSNPRLCSMTGYTTFHCIVLGSGRYTQEALFCSSRACPRRAREPSRALWAYTGLLRLCCPPCPQLLPLPLTPSHTTPRNRISSSYNNITTNRYNCKTTAETNNTIMPKRKKQGKENKTHIGGSTEADMTHNRWALRRITTTLLALQSGSYQATPPRRER